MKNSNLAFRSSEDRTAASQNKSSDSYHPFNKPSDGLFKKLQRLSMLCAELNPFYQARRSKFMSVIGGHIFFQALAAGVELGLFNLLSKNGAMSVEDLSYALGIKEQPCRILLLSLASAGVVRRGWNGKYLNTKIADTWLCHDSPERMSDCVMWQKHINYQALGHFTEALKANHNVGLDVFAGYEPTLYQRLARRPELEKIFQDAMHELSQLGNVQFVKYADFSQVSYVVDVGGGDGTNISKIVQANPHLRGSVFDSPTVCGIARNNFAEHPCSDRLSAIEGDIMVDRLPKDADCILFCHFFTIWSLEENLSLLKKAYASLPAGGQVMIFNMMQNNNCSGPQSAAIGSPYFLTLATGRGMLYTWSEYEKIFTEAGFQEITQSRFPFDHGVITGRKPCLEPQNR